MRHRQFINSAVLEDEVGKLVLWGDIYENQPTNWWGEPLDIECVTVKQFKEEFEKLQKCKRIELHLNSYGGDATVGILIHNLLKESGKSITCYIDAIAASAAFTIASACEKVLVYPGSIMMCHEVKSLLWGYYGNDDLKEVMSGNTAYNNSAAAMYAKKSGMSKQQCLNLMNKTTWMDAEMAIQYGFADEIIEVDPQNEQPVELINKTQMKINGKDYDIKDLHIPDEFIEKLQKRESNLGGKQMAKESFKDKLFNAINAVFTNEADDGKEVTTQEQAQQPSQEDEEPEVDETKIENAVKAERERIQSIQKMSNGIDADLVQEAMFGEKRCDAATLALRAKQRDDEKKSNALKNLESDAQASKVNDVSSEPGKISSDHLKESDERDAAIKAMRAKLNKEGK